MAKKWPVKIIRQRSFQFNVVDGKWYFCLYKGRKRIAINVSIFETTKEIEGRRILAPTEVRRLISWLSSYLAWADPKPKDLIIANAKAHTKSLSNNIDRLAGEF